MLKVGLSGNIGSGKSLVSKIFETLNIPVYHSDDRAKYILDKPEIISELKKLFGNEIIDAYGKPDKKKIARIVFNNSEKLSDLNNVIHPAVLKDFEAWITDQGRSSYVVMESAILFETGFSKLFDKIIVVTAPENIRIQRVLKRDHVAEEDITKRIKNQMTDEAKARQSDFLIVNDNKEPVIPQVLKIHQTLSVL